jgi:hypothetical protein
MKRRDGAGQGKGLAAAPSPETPSRLGEVCQTHNQFAELDKHKSFGKRQFVSQIELARSAGRSWLRVFERCRCRNMHRSPVHRGAGGSFRKNWIGLRA